MKAFHAFRAVPKKASTGFVVVNTTTRGSNRRHFCRSAKGLSLAASRLHGFTRYFPGGGRIS